MPLTTASGGIAIAEHLLAQTLSNCTQWIADTNHTTAAQSLTRIHFDALPVPEDKHSYRKEEYEAMRPFAIISTHPMQRGYRMRRIAAGSCFADGGSMFLAFEYNVPPELSDDDAELMRRFKNSLGKILRSDADPAVGLCDLAHDPGYFAIDEIELVVLGRSDERVNASQGDFLIAQFLIHWGRGDA